MIRAAAALAALLLAAPALSCSPVRDDYIRKHADAIVVARVEVVTIEPYDLQGIPNFRGVAMARVRQIVRGGPQTSYRLVFDSADDGINCPGWSPAGRDRTQRLFLVAAERTGEWRVWRGGD